MNILALLVAWEQDAVAIQTWFTDAHVRVKGATPAP
jgi:hypothetical protein